MLILSEKFFSKGKSYPVQAINFRNGTYQHKGTVNLREVGTKTYRYKDFELIVKVHLGEYYTFVRNIHLKPYSINGFEVQGNIVTLYQINSIVDFHMLVDLHIFKEVPSKNIERLLSSYTLESLPSQKYSIGSSRGLFDYRGFRCYFRVSTSGEIYKGYVLVILNRSKDIRYRGKLLNDVYCFKTNITSKRDVKLFIDNAFSGVYPYTPEYMCKSKAR